MQRSPAIEALDVEVFTIPTSKQPESDGTLEWDSTTMVWVEVRAAGLRGIGYTYSHPAAASLIRDTLAVAICGLGAFEVPRAWQAMIRAVRNIGRTGITSSAIAAVDVALWDLKAKLLGLPLVDLLGGRRDQVPLYGSGGFCSLSIDELQCQLRGWVDVGIPRVKMKVGADPGGDVERVAAAREAIGDDVELFVDANGAYTRKQAIGFAAAFAAYDVRWFEEPVSSDDLVGLRYIRDHTPPAVAVTAGEYGYDTMYFRRMLDAEAVDVLQADITRCLGVTGLMNVDALCQAYSMPLSLHTAPAAHLHPAAAMQSLVHLEYFHDHERIERLLLDGLPELESGALVPDRTKPGLGIELNRQEAKRYAA